MTTLNYEANARRLRIAGGCRSDDSSTIQEAFAAFANLADGHLIVDLTAVTEIDQAVADDLLAAARRWSRDGGTFSFVRKGGTVVDDALVAAAEAVDRA